MKKTTVRDLRYHFPEIEARLNEGEEIVVHNLRKMIARLLPICPRSDVCPDFPPSDDGSLVQRRFAKLVPNSRLRSGGRY